MTLVEEIFKTLWDNQFFTPGSKLYLPDIIPATISAPDIENFELSVPLSGGCAKGSTQGKAFLDLTGMVVSGGGSVQKNGDYSDIATNDYTEFTIPLKFSGNYVPAHRKDFLIYNNKVNDTPNCQLLDPNCDNGYPLCGPNTLTGISDFQGIKVNGNFHVHQACAQCEPVDPTGKFIATLNNLTMQIKLRFYIPADPSKPLYIKVTEFKVDDVKTENITLTLLNQDGALPQYDMNKLPNDDTVAWNFWFAQQSINYPGANMTGTKMDPLKMIADKITSTIQDNDTNASIRESLEDQVNDYLKKF